eukprot:scaffold39257_cov24-Phaeocystis_antarctica.AAC.1
MAGSPPSRCRRRGVDRGPSVCRGVDRGPLTIVEISGGPECGVGFVQFSARVARSGSILFAQPQLPAVEPRAS